MREGTGESRRGPGGVGPRGHRPGMTVGEVLEILDPEARGDAALAPWRRRHRTAIRAATEGSWPW